VFLTLVTTIKGLQKNLITLTVKLKNVLVSIILIRYKGIVLESDYNMYKTH